jgi:putative membrane protein insertion efficiency factor
MVNRIFSWFFVGLIKVYQFTLSPFLGKQCRFVPTCSQYGIEAIKKHGALKGSWLTIKRIVRCNPWGSSGYDPVP